MSEAQITAGQMALKFCWLAKLGVIPLPSPLVVALAVQELVQQAERDYGPASDAPAVSEK